MRGMVGEVAVAVAREARAGVGAAEGAAEEEGENTVRLRRERGPNL